MRLYLPQWHSQSFTGPKIARRKPVPLRLERPVVDGLGLGDSQIPRAWPLRSRRSRSFECAGPGSPPGRRIWISRSSSAAPASGSQSSSSPSLILHVSWCQGHSTQGLEFLHNTLKDRGCGFRQVLPLEDARTRGCGRSRRPDLDGQDPCSGVRRPVRFQRHTSISRRWPSELRLAGSGCCVTASTADGAGVNLSSTRCAVSSCRSSRRSRRTRRTRPSGRRAAVPSRRR